MAKNQANIRIYGDDDDAVWTAPKGSTLPTDLAAPAAPFEELGWLGEDGINIEQSFTRNKFNAHQGGALVRGKNSGLERTFAFACLEETATVLGLYYPGITGTRDVATGVTRYTVPAGARSNERAWVVDCHDDGVQKRLVVDVGEVAETGTIAHTNSGLTIYQFTVDILGDFELIGNSPSWTSIPAV